MIKNYLADYTDMASITQAMKKISFSLTKPLVKLVDGKKIPLTENETKRLPPGQYATESFLTLHHETSFPTAHDIANWKLVIDGEVKKPISMTLAELKKLPEADITSDFHCVTSWTRFDNKWKGVRVSDVLKLAHPTAKYVTQTAFGGHTTSTPIEDLDEAYIVWEQEGKPLTLEHGAPIRVILPKKYAYKGVKWLNKLTVTKEEELGFWEVRGYSQTADPWKNDRYS